MADPVAPLKIDWSSLRAAAVALGNVQAAARQAAANLPKEEQARFIETVAKRAQREGWLIKAEQVVATAAAEPKSLSGTMSGNVLSGHELLQNMGKDSKAKLALGVNKKAGHLSAQEPADISTTDLLQLTKAGSTLHGWQEQAKAGPLVSLTFTSNSDFAQGIKDVSDAAAQLPGPDAPTE